MILIVANVGTALALFPVLKWQNEGATLGYVAARLVECAFIAVGSVSLLAIVTLRQDVGGAGGAGSLVTVGRSLVAIHDWTFLLGPGFIVGVGKALAGLPDVPVRPGATGHGHAGAHRRSPDHRFGDRRAVRRLRARLRPQVIATAPEFVWELSLGIHLMVKGFRPSPILREGSAAAGPYAGT